MKKINELRLNLTSKERKNLFLFYTDNQDDSIKIKLKDIKKVKRIFIKKSLKSNPEKYIFNFFDIPINKHKELKKNIINDFFSKLEEATNQFIVSVLVESLIYDLDNYLYEINQEKNYQDTISYNTFYFCDFKDYNNINEFLIKNYEEKLRPIYHDKNNLTTYCLKQHYIEEYDLFICEFFNKIIINNLKKESLDPYIDNFHLLQDNNGKKILSYFLKNITHSYLEQILSLKIDDFFDIMNMKKYNKIFNDLKTKNKNKNNENYKNKKIVYDFINNIKKKNKNFEIQINQHKYSQNIDNLEESIYKEFIKFKHSNKKLLFTIKIKTKINNVDVIEGFYYSKLKKIEFLNKRNHTKIENTFIKDFSFKKAIISIFN